MEGRETCFKSVLLGRTVFLVLFRNSEFCFTELSLKSNVFFDDEHGLEMMNFLNENRNQLLPHSIIYLKIEHPITITHF